MQLYYAIRPYGANNLTDEKQFATLADARAHWRKVGGVAVDLSQGWDVTALMTRDF